MLPIGLGVLRFQTGDLLQAEVEALVNPVNCVGVMGDGPRLGAPVQTSLPKNFHIYADVCAYRGLQPKEVLVVRIDQQTHHRYILNFPLNATGVSRVRSTTLKEDLKCL